MTATGKSRGIAYAEDKLHVHLVYEEATLMNKTLKSAQDNLANKRKEEREIEAEIEQRELEIFADEHGKHPDLSVAAMDRHLKQVVPKDKTIAKLRTNLSTIVHQREVAFNEVKHTESELRTINARMTQLGGYLYYLAALKAAQDS